MKNNKLYGGWQLCYNCFNMVKNGTIHKCSKPKSFKERHEEIEKFLKEYRDFKEQSRKVKIIAK